MNKQTFAIPSGCKAISAEFNKLGYEYDFLMHDAKKIVWQPTDKDDYWFVNDFINVVKSGWYYNSSDMLRHKSGNCFKTEAEAQKFKEYILAYDPQKNN